MTIILDGGGGCGKTTLALDVLLPLQEAFFGQHGVLRRAPSNKPARSLGGRTMHSSQGFTAESSLMIASTAFSRLEHAPCIERVAMMSSAKLAQVLYSLECSL